VSLRYYQEGAVEAVYNHIRWRDNNPCVVLPTGSGKTHVIAKMVEDCVLRWNRRVIVLAHVKELLEQAEAKLAQYCPDVPTGIYCAGLNEKRHTQPCTLASIQSVYKQALNIDPVDLIIVDEAHLIPTGGEGMYRKFISEMMVVNPNAKVVGLTATPYRTDSGLICGPNNVLNKIVYDAGVATLIEEGYLCSLKNKAMDSTIDTTGIEKQGGDFRRAHLEARADTNEIVNAAISEMLSRAGDRNSILIFCCGVAHANHVAETITSASGEHCAVITGKTPSGERADTIEQFKAGRIRFLANINVLTTGFDAPNIDCIVMLRPTLSPGLYYQMVGRGLRVDPSKQDCLILDFSDNIKRHGPINAVQPKNTGSPSCPREPRDDAEPKGKVCPKCGSVATVEDLQCWDCGYEWPEPEIAKHGTTADSDSDILGVKPPETITIQGVMYTPWTRKNATPDDKSTVRVDYMDGVGFTVASEWICPEHTGFARRKFDDWWHERCLLRADETVSTIADFMLFANAGCLVEPSTIEVTQDGKFARVKPLDMPTPYSTEELDKKLEAVGAFGNTVDDDWDDDEAPF